MEKQANNLQVECSPNTFRRLETDEDYRNEVTRQVLESQPSDLDFIPNILVSEVPRVQSSSEEYQFANDLATEFSDDPNVAAEFAGDQNGTKDIWLEAPTKLLLSVVGELLPLVGKTFKLKNKTRMWKITQEKLAAENYEFTVAQVQGKYRALERKYKETKLHNSKTGRNRKTCPYESDLDKILGEKRGIHPDFVLESDSVAGTSREGLVQNASQESIPSTSDEGSPALKRKRPLESCRDRMFKRIDDMAREKAEYHANLLKSLEYSQKLEKEKIEILNKIFEKIDKK